MLPSLRFSLSISLGAGFFVRLYICIEWPQQAQILHALWFTFQKEKTMVSFQDSSPKIHCSDWVIGSSPSQSLWWGWRYNITQWWLVFSIRMCSAPEVHGLGVTKTYPWKISTHYYCHVLRAIYQTLPNIFSTASHSYICSFRKFTEVLLWWPKIHGHYSQFRM